MQNDEDQIRQLVTTWMQATKAGDVDTVLSLVSDDVVFLTPGRAPMGKSEFASIARAQADPSGPTIDGTSEVQEIKVAGDWAFMWTKLSVVVEPRDGSPSMERAGNTLTVLNKQDGRWVLARDANLLSPVRQDTDATR